MLKYICIRLFFVATLSISSFFIQSYAAKGEDIQLKDKKKVDQTMRIFQINIENLHIAFEQKDWRKIQKLSQEIAESCAGIEDSRKGVDMPIEFDDFKLANENLRDYAKEIMNASMMRDIDAVKKAYKNMEDTCTQCHNKFRK